MADRWRIRWSRRGDREFFVCEEEEKKVTKVEKKQILTENEENIRTMPLRSLSVFPSFE